MEKNEFIVTLQKAVKELDRDALSCMARVLLVVAEQSGENYSFSCPQGIVKIEASINLNKEDSLTTNTH